VIKTWGEDYDIYPLPLFIWAADYRRLVKNKRP